MNKKVPSVVPLTNEKAYKHSTNLVKNSHKSRYFYGWQNGDISNL